MYYTVYKTTNLVNGKFYIGTHKTKHLNDDYLGSGKYLKRAIEKHGKENFKKEILFVFDNPEEMFAKEAELVTEDFIAENNCYNLKAGGSGGFDLINKNGTNSGILNRAKHITPEIRARAIKSLWNRFYSDENFRLIWSSQKSQQNYASGFNKCWLGRKHKQETKNKISKIRKNTGIAEKNSQYGSKWITKDGINKKLKYGEPLPDGWKYGRVC